MCTEQNIKIGNFVLLQNSRNLHESFEENVLFFALFYKGLYGMENRHEKIQI